MRTLSFSGLLFVCSTLTVGCNAWVDIEPIDPPGGDNGYGGDGGSGGKGGHPGTGGSGTSGTAGSGDGGSGGCGPYGCGTGGTAGGGGSGTGGSGTGGSGGSGAGVCDGLGDPGFGVGLECGFNTALFSSTDFGITDCNSFLEKCQQFAEDFGDSIIGLKCNWNGTYIFAHEPPEFPGVCGLGGGGSGGSGTGGSGGNGGDGGGGSPPIDEGERVFVGGDIDEIREVFPFGVAVANNGAIFVSTLGNRDNEPSRIYRFNPGDNAAPEILFEVGNSNDQAIYGLGFTKGKLYACSSQHLLSANGNIIPSIFEFDAGQLNQNNLGPNNVKNFQLRATAVNANNNGFVVADAEEAGRCGQFATDNDGVLYIPDVSGQTDFIFRLNPAGTLNQPGGQVGDPINPAVLDDLKITAWYEDPQIVGNLFGTPGITFDGSTLQMFFENNGSQLFSLRPVGTSPEGTIENTTINQALATPFGLAAVTSNQFIASDSATNELVVLNADQGELNASILFDSSDDPSFSAPASVTVVDDKAVVVGSQFDQLGGVMFEDGKVFVIRY